MGRLTAKAVQHAKAGRHSDGEGLFLAVTAAGSRRWFYRYQLRGRRRDMGLGSHPPVSLAEARERAAVARAMVRRGVDPLEARAAPEAPTFATAAAVYIRTHRRSWVRRWARTWVRSLRVHATTLRPMRVDEVDTEAVLRVLTPVWRKHVRLAPQLRQRIEAVLDMASARGWRSGENPARWRGHLAHLLAEPKKSTRFDALPWADVPAFFNAIPQTPAGDALRLLTLTGVRAQEARWMRWCEVDGDIWVLPAERTKQRREHRVPLAAPALALLSRQPRTGEWVFGGVRIGQPIGERALRRAYACTGFPGTVHGLRAAFRTWAGEETATPADVAEAALGHAVGTGLERRYNRGDLLEKRRRLMTAWAGFVIGGRRTVQLVAAG